jgi:hypothetical protein
MPQLVGKMCGVCNERVSCELDAVFCPQCHNPVHNQCVRPTEVLSENNCSYCCTNLKAALARRVKEQEQLELATQAVPLPPSDFEKTYKWVQGAKLWLGGAILLGLGVREVIDPYLHADPKHVSTGELILGYTTILAGIALGSLGFLVVRRH